MSDKTKKIFLGLSIFVPFLLYSVYYYAKMVQNAPYKFSEFVSVELQYGDKHNLYNTFNSKSGKYQYINRKDSIVVKNIRLDSLDLQAIHRKASEMGVWNFPSEMLTNNEHGTRFYIVMNYQRKTKTILIDSDWNGTPKIADAAKQFITTVQDKIHENQVEN